jgi:hypothetical protein
MSDKELAEWESTRDLEKEITEGVEEYLKSGPARVTVVAREPKHNSD